MKLPIGTYLREALDEFVEEIEYEGRVVEAELLVGDGPIETATVATVTKLLANLGELDAICRTALRESYADDADSPVRSYLEFHAEEFGPSDDSELVAVSQHLENFEAFMQWLHLKSLAVYLGDEDSSSLLIVDYTIGKGVTDYVLAASVGTFGSVVSVVMES